MLIILLKAVKIILLELTILATASIKYKVKSFVMISTDKAVRPSNVMGASKRMAEMIIQSLNRHDQILIFQWLDLVMSLTPLVL